MYVVTQRFDQRLARNFCVCLICIILGFGFAVTTDLAFAWWHSFRHPLQGIVDKYIGPLTAGYAALYWLSIPNWIVAAIVGTTLGAKRKSDPWMVTLMFFVGFVIAPRIWTASAFGWVYPKALLFGDVFTGLLLFAGALFGNQWLGTGYQRRLVRDGRCSLCGYDLRGISSKHCPECGGARVSEIGT